MNFEAMKAEALKRVRHMDLADRKEERYLPTILTALETGLRHPETGAQFDALVMLEDLTGKLRFGIKVPLFIGE